MSQSSDSVRFVDDLTITRPNSFYTNQRIPLFPTPLQKLPPGAVKGQGWLKVQLDLQREGFAGQLSHISRFLNIKDNAWMGNGTAARAGWEELPYWLKGQVSLGYVTGDQKIIAECKSWIEGILASQKEDGWFGPESNRATKFGTPDLWPNMLAQSLLQTYYEATGDDRVIKLMSRYCDYLLALPKETLMDPRHYWHSHRVGDQLASLIWLFNRTGDEKIIELAKRVHNSGADWTAGVANRHGVNFAQAFREPATYFMFAKEKKYWDATEQDLKLFTDEFGQWPGGMYAADENARKGKSDPRQATESCSVAEMMFSHALLFEYSADPKWADKAEDVTFNWMPATMTPDLKALRYLTSANMAVSDASTKSPGIENGGPMFLMDPNDHRCCQHNIGMAWPYLVERMWFATTENGLMAAILGPSEVTAKVGADETEVKITEDTSYPFEETIRFRVNPAKAVRFPFTIRIPAWAGKASVKVNGKTSVNREESRFAFIDREWKAGDVVELTLPMKVETKSWSQRPNTLSVFRGPLAYSLKIDEEYKELPRPNGWDAFEIYPKSAWNVGLERPKFAVSKKPIKDGVQPWDLKSVPIELTTTGRVIPEWGIDMYGLAAPLQACPVFTREPSRKVTLVPMGAARLRVTVFPTVTTDSSGAKWVKPKAPRKPIPSSWSHRSFFDSEAAMSDGLLPKSSNDQDIPRFTWWDHLGTEEWVQYNFEANRTFQSCRVYFFDDTGDGRCRIPESWKIQVKAGDQWQDVEVIDPYTTVKDGWSTVKFKPTGGTQIRLVAKLKKDFSGGILEWEVN